MRTKEQILREWDKVLHVKKIAYGLGMPPEGCPFYADRNRLALELEQAELITN